MTFWLALLFAVAGGLSGWVAWIIASSRDQNAIYELRATANERQNNLAVANEHIALLRSAIGVHTAKVSELERQISAGTQLSLDRQQELVGLHSKQLLAEAVLAYIGAAHGTSAHNLDGLHRHVKDCIVAVEQWAGRRKRPEPAPESEPAGAAQPPKTVTAFDTAEPGAT